MSTTDATVQASSQRRAVDVYLGHYSADHRHPLNIVIHHVCVPLIVWSLAALGWVLPVPSAIGQPGLWVALAMVGAIGFYLRLSRVLGLAMVGVFALLGLACHLLLVALGSTTLLWTALVVFALAWLGQFIGHAIEGRRPSFFTDLAYLLIGPLWIVAKLLRRLGVAY